MSSMNRRSVLRSAVGTAGAVAVSGAAAATAEAAPAGNAAPAATARSTGPTTGSVPPAPSVTASDARYPELVRGVNQRWVAAPDAVRLVTTADQVLQIVQDAATAGKRVAVRSGGHCYCDFVSNAQTQIIIDLSAMHAITYDTERCAFSVEAGAQLGQVYEVLYREWGVTVPGGVCPSVGIGGHATGGGFGLLTRQFGLVADYIEAVEAVVVDSRRKAHRIVASRNPSDPNHDLWWAVTGGGGGSFGVITRYWFRSADATGSNPSAQLPAPPKSILLSSVGAPWATVSQDQFTQLVTNFTNWYLANSAAGSDLLGLSGVLLAKARSGGGLGLLTQIDASIPDAADVLAEYGQAVTAGTGITTPFLGRPVNWLASTKLVALNNPVLLYDPTMRSAIKTAWTKQNFTDAQLATIYQQLLRTDFDNANATLQLAGAGGRMNQVDRTATASVHRDAVLFAEFETFWVSPADDAANLAWLRDIYGRTFADTGGYPVPGDRFDGTYINNPDTDITDPAYNISGVPWTTLYWGENYPRLQQAKAAFDPTDFFRHAQSVRLPGAS
ncbi:FAD-dependent oxidoreductase [Actinacidiphila yeochonensis]|uniref:FAD-dependent oxidoreductase n=1 Tax=Actinacidiphila yeochonensis TaxID=89050 RepID=UPI000560CFD4|nr:FAD-binding protein [Actinacidiphila yeochonensis]